ncbi:MAG: class I SAM-dependent methyltransferase [Thermomicrobiales bacterium]
MPEGWDWDETLYLGSAPYYMRGRPPYAPGLADALARFLSLDGQGRLIDIGCGPGVITLPLAPHFAVVIGVDPDAGMLAEGERRAAAAGIGNIRWVRARAEELPAGLGVFEAATFAQSFHWMDRDRVAAVVRQLLAPGGAFVHVSDVKDAVAQPEDLPHPTPPYGTIRGLIRHYLGPIPRAGQGMLRHGSSDGEAIVLREAGYLGPDYLRVPAAGPLVRTADDLVAWVYSLSGSAPHLFGARGSVFESDLRAVLRDASPAGLFSEQPPDTEIFVWRAPRSPAQGGRALRVPIALGKSPDR